MNRRCPLASALPFLMAAILTAFHPQTAGAQAPAPDLAVDAARSAFEALPETDRKAVQDALVWTGDYNGVADGTFGRQTYAAIAAYQARLRQQPNGILAPQARAALLGAAQQARSAAGFTLIDDQRTGIRLGVPVKFLPKQSPTPTGSRWQSADDRITLDTRSAPPDATLQSLYDRNTAIQTPGRVVSYKLLRPDFFVIAGETAGGKFYTRYSAGTEGLRGLSIGYDKALAPQFDRMVVAIANSFTPFPAQAAPAAISQNPAPAPLVQAKPQALKVIGTGLVVGSRQVVSTAPLASCKEVQVSGITPRAVSGQGPVVIDFTEDLKAQPLKIAQGTIAEGASSLVIGFINEGESANLVALPGQFVSANTISAPLQPGISGAPILDATGALVGLVGTVPSERRMIAGIVPAASYPVTPISALGGALPASTTQGQQPISKKRSAADLVGLVRSALVPITCGS